MRLSNFINSLMTNLIPPKIQIWPKFLAQYLYLNRHSLLNTLWIPTNEGSKFTLDCLESNNSHISLIDVNNLTLLNFVYLF